MYVPVGRGRLLVDDVGTGPAVVLLHGLGSFKGLWSETRDVLRAAGFRVIAYDHRGHGGSDDVAPPWGIGDLANDLLAVLDRLGVTRACVVGHSMGGRTMFKFALDWPERTWALVAVGAQSEAPRAAYRPVIEELRQAVTSDGVAGFRRAFEAADEVPERVRWDPGFAAAFEADFARNRAPMLLAALDAVLTMPMLTPRLGEIRVPMLAVVGERDQHFRALADHYSTVVPDCRTVVIEGCHHYPMNDAPAPFIRSLLAFLREARQGAPGDPAEGA